VSFFSRPLELGLKKYIDTDLMKAFSQDVDLMIEYNLNKTNDIKHNYRVLSVPNVNDTLIISESKLSLVMNEVFKTTRTQAFEVDLPKFVPASGGTFLLYRIHF
jgi:hypothetical protein